MISEYNEVIMDGSWQLLATEGLKEVFFALEIENIDANSNPVLLRRKTAGVERSLEPGDIDRIEAPQEWKEPIKDSGIAVKGTAPDVVKFEQILLDYQE